MNFRFFIPMLALLPIIGCASETITISSRPITIDTARASDPSAVRMLPVNFRVITRENVDTFISEMSATPQNSNVVFMVITVRDYENIRLNFADLRRYVEQQRAVIAYYREVISTPPETVTTRSNGPRQ